MSNSNKSTLSEIISELERTAPLERATVLGWMQTDDLEAAGALMSLLADEEQFKRIQPPLADRECFSFIAKYYERTLLESPDGEWSDSRTTAGWDFAKWFLELWDSRSVSREVLSNLKAMLERVCKDGGPATCKALVTAVMEHLFQRSEIVTYFSEWAEDPNLASAYAEAVRLASLKRPN